MSAVQAPHDVLVPADFERWLRAAGVIADATQKVTQVAPVGTGQMADTYRVTLSPAPSSPATVIVKAPARDSGSAEVAAQAGAYEREVRFYRDIAPRLEMSTPRLMGSADIAELGGPILVLEDLSGIAVQGDQLAGTSAQSMADMLDQLVLLQTPLWGDGGMASQSWLFRRCGVSAPRPQELYQRAWAVVQTRIGDRFSPQQRAVIERFSQSLTAWSMSMPQPFTLAHQDFRIDNVMFGQERLYVVDWQTLGWGSPAWDVAYAVGSSLTTQERRNCERELVHRWADGLAAHGIEGWSRDTAWNEYRRLAFSGLVINVTAAGRVVQTERGDRMFATILDRVTTQILDLDALELLAC